MDPDLAWIRIPKLNPDTGEKFHANSLPMMSFHGCTFLAYAYWAVVAEMSRLWCQGLSVTVLPWMSCLEYLSYPILVVLYWPFCHGARIVTVL